MIRKRSLVVANVSRVKKVSQEFRHRSLQSDKKRPQRRSVKTVHVNVRQTKVNQPTHKDSANLLELSLSAMSSTQCYQKKFNQPSLDKSSSESTKHMPHTLNESTQNTWDNNDLSINSKMQKNDVINTPKRITNNQKQRYKSSAIHTILTINSSQNNSTQQVLEISNGSNAMTTSQQLDKLDFVGDSNKFSTRKQRKSNRNKRRKILCWPPSCLCVVGCTLGLLLLGITVSAIIVGLLSNQKSATTITTTTASTATTTTMTTASATTATTTTSTTATSSTMSTTTTSTVTSSITSTTTTSSTTSATTFTTRTSTSTSSTTTKTTSTTTTSTTTSSTRTSTSTSSTTSRTTSTTTTPTTSTTKTSTTTTTSTMGPGPCISIDPANTTAWGNDRTFYGSEGNPCVVSCVSPTPTLTLLQAFYGLNSASVCNCVTMDVTAKVLMKCNTTSCSFTINNSLFTDTCHSHVKTFWMHYTCT